MGVLGDRRLRRAARDDQLSVVDHLDELRNRLIVSGVALVVAFAVAYAFHEQLIEFLEKPLPERFQETGLITLSPTEPFFTTLKVCFWAAILASLPVWLYQLYAFVIPAVQDQSRRRMLTIVGASRRRSSSPAWPSASTSSCRSPCSSCSTSAATPS